jgi:hypothetical protein
VRLRQLEALNNDDDAAGASSLMRVPDGVALTDQSQQQLLLQTDGTTVDQTSAPQEEVELRNPLSCYICHKPYRKLHFFYDKLCPECAAFNYMKRDEMCDMNGNYHRFLCFSFGFSVGFVQIFLIFFRFTKIFCFCY